MQVAETLFGEQKLKQYSERYGGYWRFKDMCDYCYLVNPWFPCDKMMSEIKNSFEELMTQYPSGRHIVSTAMASMLGVSEEFVAVGNGAAELIRILMKNLRGKVYITSPSFNEYANSAENAEVKAVSCEDNAFSYGSSFILNNSADCDTVIIINPDNPSGNFIGRAEMLELIDELAKRNKRIIVDESFADFADRECRYSLLNNSILTEYPCLTVVKSISKSYGVPGIRLGALCSADTELIDSVNHGLPIWNINSYAEFFMQICGKYGNEYIEACNKIASERKRFSDKLKATGRFEVYPSQANYLMCRLKEGTADELAEFLIERNFFIKSLNGKNGCQNGEYIRLAIKTPEQNDRLIQILSEY